ncbi:DHA1 family bicyclomycin/chloramphenicol resistance-like MFS transporter [Frondihabitans sp. PhB188]|uniref:Bcr/CflA family efflux MFS transporter n=1 Tax=Frondihabitans sp. PhB188 TaxID=2485200 RepID=UPI000F4A5019|nr:Bcr/CflA family efflux MFS transporter [Frondihabitans sp. PhB188]ROQ41577.1 DHA1 family bicyclomycin/chloramphenicol resistance-like MFS transporter [Frondihabitans sp. PhB188]
MTTIDIAADTATRSRAGLVRRIVVVAVFLTWLGPFTMDAYSPGFPSIAREFGVGDWAVQLTLTASLAGLVLGQLLGAPLADRFGRRGPLIGSLVVFLIATLACALAPHIAFLIVARLFQGVAAAIGVSTSRTLGRDVLERRRLAPFFSQLAAITSIAPVVGPLVGSALMNAGGSWRWIFAMIGALGFVVLVVVVLALPETHPDRIDRSLAPAEREVPSDVSTGGHGKVRTLLGQRAVLASALAIGLSSGALLSYLAGTSILLQDRYGLSATQYAVVFALNAVGLLIAAQVNARLVRRIRPGVVATAAAGALAADGLALVVAFAAAAPLGVILGMLAVVVMCAGFLGSNVIAIGMSVDRHAGSTASAILGVAQYSFGALSAPLVGLGAAAVVPSQAWLVAGYGAATVVAVVVVGGRAFRDRLAPSGR